MQRFKHEMVKLSFWLFLLVILLISVRVSNISFFIIACCLLILTYILLIYLENLKITKNIKSYMDENNYQKAIDNIKKLIPKLYFEKNLEYSLIMLAELYMLNDEAIKAKALIEHNPKLKEDVRTYHIQLILAIAEENVNRKGHIVYNVSLLHKKRHLKYKEAVKPIIRLGDRKKFDEELYQNTEYPLVKKLCLKYTDEPQKIDDLNLEQVPTNNYFKSSNSKQLILKILLNVLSFLSLIIALLLMVIISENNKSMTFIDTLYENIYNYTKYYWVILLFSLIPFTNVIMAIYFRSKRIKHYFNLLIGKIIGITLLVLGFTHLMVYSSFNTQKSYLNTYSNSIEMPEDYTLINCSLNITTRSQYSKTIMKSVTVVRINDQDYRYFVKKGWYKDLSYYNGAPKVIKEETVNFDYFKVYNVTMAEHSDDSYSQNNEYILYAYDNATNVLLIYNYEVV